MSPSTHSMVPSDNVDGSMELDLRFPIPPDVSRVPLVRSTIAGFPLRPTSAINSSSELGCAPVPFADRFLDAKSPPPPSRDSARVAEYSSVCRRMRNRPLTSASCLSTSCIMCFSSLKCPCSTMRSASSRTRNWRLPIAERCSSPSCINDHSRPGVPTTMSGLRDSMRRCFGRAMPPTNATSTRSVFAVTASMWRLTCIASSRVGATTRARKLARCAEDAPASGCAMLSSALTIGIPKARVLPEPVWSECEGEGYVCESAPSRIGRGGDV